MPNLIARLPPLRSLNRNLLLVVLTTLLWALDMIWQLLVDPFYPWASPGSLHKQIGSNIVVHLLFLPVLVLCYFAAMQIPRFIKGRLPAILAYTVLGLGVASLTHLFVIMAIYLVTGDINAPGTHFAGLMEAGFDPKPWITDMMMVFTIYLLGLFVIYGVNARLDLENERIRSSDLYTLWLNARLDTLRSQLNPHFLFNSLHTISSLLFTDTRRADKLLADFSDVLRITLRDGQREFASVREELDYARRYLSIEETRFEDRLSTQFETEEASLGARVPSLILQPLIENAIKYGISSSSGRNHVTVTARCGGDTLVLEICNDFRNEAVVSPDRKMGIGLRNVRERLSAIYGADFILTSEPVSGQRWSSRICIPYTSAGEA